MQKPPTFWTAPTHCPLWQVPVAPERQTLVLSGGVHAAPSFCGVNTHCPFGPQVEAAQVVLWHPPDPPSEPQAPKTQKPVKQPAWHVYSKGLLKFVPRFTHDVRLTLVLHAWQSLPGLRVPFG